MRILLEGREMNELPHGPFEKGYQPADAMKALDEKIKKVSERGTWDGVNVDKYLNEIRGGLTWKDICRICEVAAGMLGKNINEELMGRYESPQEFYEKVLEKI